MRIGRLSVRLHFRPERWDLGRFVWPSSVVLMLGPLELRWWRR